MEYLHVISFDIPYPANYGGVIVVYNQLKALKECGVKVILHAFKYGDRQEQDQLNTICEEVIYYQRETGVIPNLSTLPYIVNSRKSKALLARLLEDDYPILFEGVHSTAWINHPDLSRRKKAVRMHNIEWRYYETLYKLSDSTLQKSYFKIEAKRLKNYDDIVLKHADALITISESEQAYYQAKFKACHLMPAPHGETFQSELGTGDYFLYHGKLSVLDNDQSAQHLIKSVFSKTDARLVIAGMNPTDKLISEVAKNDNVSLVANPSHEEMDRLIREAQANILYTFQDNGLKLKLLHALFVGRHCIVNEEMVSSAPKLADLCHVETDRESLIHFINSLCDDPFTRDMRDKRQQVLEENFDNKQNTLAALSFLKKNGFN